MKKIAVVSLRFAPGHLAHLRAYYKLFSDLGCNARLFLDRKYNSFFYNEDYIEFIDSSDAILSWSPNLVLSYNVSNKNIKLALACKKSRIPFYYILHEPLGGIKELFSLRKRLFRRIAANIANYLTSHYAYKVILASENGKVKYLKYMKHCNQNYDVFPLIFCDDFDASKKEKREFFSFIGGFTAMRGHNEFIDFIKYSIQNKKETRFCIATRNDIDGFLNDPVLHQAITDGILSIYAGAPMTSDEINSHYRESLCVWNAYIDSTQSGVLANALMQGAPVLVTQRGDSTGIITDKKEGCFISLPHNNEEIDSAFQYIVSHIEEMSTNARNTFHNKYEYKSQLNKAKSVYGIS